MESDKIDKAREVIQKLTKKLGGDVAQELRALPSEKAADMIVNLTKEMGDINDQKKDDVVRSRLQEDLKLINDGYKSLLSERKDRIALLMAFLVERGVK